MILVQMSFKLDPFSNAIFVFCNSKRDKIKLLYWENNGFWLYYRRLEKGRFKWPDHPEDKVMAITERELRWLFTNTPAGADSSAIVYSIIETAKENNRIPFEYLRYLFETLPNMDIRNIEELDKLLPWSEELPSNCIAKL